MTIIESPVQVAQQQTRELPPPEKREVVFDVSDLTVSYGENPALKNVSLDVYKNFVTAFIGPSGCGNSTFIRCFNRMNDLIPSAVVEGTILYRGQDLYGPDVDAVEVRRRIGMVFQKPNPFPKSIYDNVAFGPRVLGMTDDLDGRVERALHQAALWDEVKDRLEDGALGLWAASNSGSASHAASPSSLTSCSWTSRHPPSTPSRRRASRTHARSQA